MTKNAACNSHLKAETNIDSEMSRNVGSHCSQYTSQVNLPLLDYTLPQSRHSNQQQLKHTGWRKSNSESALVLMMSRKLQQLSYDYITGFICYKFCEDPNKR